MVRDRRAPEGRRADIIAVARELFATKGVAETSVSEIVRAAGVAQGTFYLYFASKEVAVNAVVEDIANEMCGAIETMSRSRELASLEKVAHIRDLLLGNAGCSPSERRLIEYFQAKGDRRFHDELCRELVKRLVPAVTEAIAQGVEEGNFDVADPEATAHVVLAASIVLHDQPASFDQPTLDRRSDAYWSLLLRALGCAQQVRR